MGRLVKHGHVALVQEVNGALFSGIEDVLQVDGARSESDPTSATNILCLQLDLQGCGCQEISRPCKGSAPELLGNVVAQDERTMQQLVGPLASEDDVGPWPTCSTKARLRHVDEDLPVVIGVAEQLQQGLEIQVLGNSEPGYGVGNERKPC